MPTAVVVYCQFIPVPTVGTVLLLAVDASSISISSNTKDKTRIMRATCFIAAAAALSCSDAFCFSPARMSSGDVLAPFQAGKALKVPWESCTHTNSSIRIQLLASHVLKRWQPVKHEIVSVHMHRCAVSS